MLRGIISQLIYYDRSQMMSRTTDWVLEQEAKGEIVFNGTQYVPSNQDNNQSEDIFDRFERAEFELDLALTNWSTLKNEINKRV